MNTPWLTSLTLAYLLGSIPFGLLLVAIFRHQDIRSIGSGNIGATNVMRSGSKGLAIATLLLDAGKAYAAVALARIIGHGDYTLETFAALAAVLGHVFPIWLRFRGGKGVACGLGVFLALAPAAGLSGLAVFILVVALTRYVSLGSILAASLMPLFAYLFAPVHSPVITVGFTSIALILVLKHYQNIARLKAGTENRLGTKPKVAA